MASTYDFVVLGGGHNGLITTAYLSKAGFKVCCLEANDEFGGSTRSGEVTAPGYVSELGGMVPVSYTHLRAAFSQRLTSRLLSSMHGFLRPLRRALPFFWSLRSGAHVTENIAILGRNTSTVSYTHLLAFYQGGQAGGGAGAHRFPYRFRHRKGKDCSPG